MRSMCKFVGMDVFCDYLRVRMRWVSFVKFSLHYIIVFVLVSEIEEGQRNDVLHKQNNKSKYHIEQKISSNSSLQLYVHLFVYILLKHCCFSTHCCLSHSLLFFVLPFLSFRRFFLFCYVLQFNLLVCLENPSKCHNNNSNVHS